jgi:hypothetical protein
MRFKVMPRPLSAPRPPPVRWLVYLESGIESKIVEFSDYAEAMRHAQDQSKITGTTGVEVSDCLGRIVWQYSRSTQNGVQSIP